MTAAPLAAAIAGPPAHCTLGTEGEALAEPPDDLRQVLAQRYALERELGRGASATVYLARDLKYRRPVAIKVLSRELALAVRVEHFQREIDTAAQLDHPHILPLFEADSLGGYLFYTMPPAEGNSLRDRIALRGPLEVDEAVRIAVQVADALDYAHRRGVVHRDIKPGNILLGDGHARVADFGIARAIARDTGTTVTLTGTPMGTLAYMSPEQMRGAEDLDGRSDIYGLGCVLYEMLTGEPPFAGTPESVVARHLTDPLPSVRSSRPEVSSGLERIIARATAKERHDRFRTAREFQQALRRGDTESPKPHGAARAVAVAAVVAFSALVDGPPSEAGERTGVVLDPLRYAILPPFEYQGSLITPVHEDQQLHDALSWWRDITVVDPIQVREALGRRGGRPLDRRAAAAVATDIGAAFFIRGEVSRIADSLRIHATLYDTRTALAVRDASVRLATDMAAAGDAFAALAQRLLFGDDERISRLGGDPATRSFLARREYARGLAAVEQWELAAADSAFVAATGHDPGFAQAHLWAAQVRYWDGAPPARWRSNAERAAAGRVSLTSRDDLLTDALTALGRGEVERACAVWSRLTTLTPHDFAGWYGLASCLSRDSVVLRDRVSPSGWRFRSSYYRATKAYERAFQLLPSIHKALSPRSYAWVRHLLFTSGSTVRVGHALPPDTTRFAAHPGWHADTLTFVPYPLRLFVDPTFAIDREAVALAVYRERHRFREIATAWAAASPDSPDAMEALAISLELLRDPAAVDTLRRARAVATTPAERLRLAGAEVWTRVKFSIPSELEGIRAARALADSLLPRHAHPSTSEPRLLASLATLTGRANLAAALARHPAVVAEWEVPRPLAGTAGPLLVFAALGGPEDSLRALEQQLDSAIDQSLIGPMQRDARMAWLARSATMAFPDYRFSTLFKLVGQGDYSVDAEAALLRGDTLAVRRMFADVRAARRWARPADLQLDGLYTEAWLLNVLGDPRAAIAWLDPTLRELSATAPHVFVDPSNAGPLVRAMALRADLAQVLGDTAGARRWAAAVAVLWSDADPFLQPVVRRMRRLAG